MKSVSYVLMILASLSLRCKSLNTYSDTQSLSKPAKKFIDETIDFKKEFCSKSILIIDFQVLNGLLESIRVSTSLAAQYRIIEDRVQQPEFKSAELKGNMMFQQVLSSLIDSKSGVCTYEQLKELGLSPNFTNAKVTIDDEQKIWRIQLVSFKFDGISWSQTHSKVLRFPFEEEGALRNNQTTFFDSARIAIQEYSKNSSLEYSDLIEIYNIPILTAGKQEATPTSTGESEYLVSGSIQLFDGDSARAWSEIRVQESRDKNKGAFARIPRFFLKEIALSNIERIGINSTNTAILSQNGIEKQLDSTQGSKISGVQGAAISDTQGTTISDTQGSTISGVQGTTISDTQGSGVLGVQGVTSHSKERASRSRREMEDLAAAEKWNRSFRTFIASSEPPLEGLAMQVDHGHALSLSALFSEVGTGDGGCRSHDATVLLRKVSMDDSMKNTGTSLRGCIHHIESFENVSDQDVSRIGPYGFLYEIGKARP